MRFKIKLSRTSRNRFLPLNYQYELSSVIYHIIDSANAEFASFLHDEGYPAFGKQFRLFTFSRLDFSGSKVHRDRAVIEHYGEEASFEISFLIDRAAEEFIRGLFMARAFRIGDKISSIDYLVSSIETVRQPIFQKTMHYRCLSPLFIRQKREGGGEDYLMPGDEAYETLMLQNLLSKSVAYANISGQGIHEEAPALSLTPKGKIYKNGVKIKQLTERETHMIGYIYEFELTAPVELQEIGYYAGFGHLGSQGFGCVGVKNEGE